MRLTNDMRNSILKQEVANKFHDKTIKLEKDFIEACEKIVKKNSPKIAPSLKDYVCTTKYFNVDGYTFYERVSSRTGAGHIPLKGNAALYNRYPCKMENDYSSEKIDIKPTKEVITLIKAIKKTSKEKKEFEQNLKVTLNAFSTDKKLLAHVPELKDYFKDAQKAQSMALVPQDTINKVRKALK